MTGIAINFENYSKALDKYYKCHAFSPKKDFFAVVFTDITEQKKNEIELFKAKNEAEKASRIKSDFLSNMRHELRTPMNGILGFVDILLEAEYDEEKKEYLEIVKQCSKQLLNMVNDVLCLSNIESGKYLYSEKLINMFSVIDRLMRFYEEQAKAKGLNFYFEFDNSLKKDILMDEKMLLQIVTNLMSNSIKFTLKGYVLLSVKDLKDNRLEIIVKDTGIGINKEKQKRLFEPFDQGEYYLTKSYGGTGLGLSIVSKLVEMLGGVITVETENGKGTQFKIILPFKNSEANEEKQGETVNDIKIKNSIKIISAEDAEINQKLLEKMFKDKNWELKKVYNGKELIEKLDTEKYDIILMDIQMPEMNGLEATKIIRNNKKYEDIPIIGLSAYALEEDVEKALNMGMNDYLSKPFKKEELIGKIERFCSL